MFICSANRSDELNGLDYDPTSAEHSIYMDDETKPLIQQQDITDYTQQPDFISLTPSSVAFDDASDMSRISYTQLQPL